MDVNKNDFSEFRDKPHNTEAFSPGHGVRACTLTHAIQLIDRDVQTHEVFQCVLTDWRCPCKAELAAIQAKSSTYPLKDHVVSQCEAPGH